MSCLMKICLYLVYTFCRKKIFSRDKDRETERETEKQRETDRQTNRQTDGDRETERDRERQRDKETETERVKSFGIKTIYHKIKSIQDDP